MNFAVLLAAERGAAEVCGGVVGGGVRGRGGGGGGGGGGRGDGGGATVQRVIM